MAMGRVGPPAPRPANSRGGAGQPSDPPTPPNRSQNPRKTLSFSKSTPQTPPFKISSSAVQPPSSSAASPPSHTGQPISFQELYKRNVLSKTEESGSTSSDSTAKPVGSNAQEPQMMIGGSDSLPASIFGKEKRESGDKAGTAMRTEFVKMYNYNELGEKLKMLRPEKKKGTWFSLQELNERLMKLREIEKKENAIMKNVD
ncbi:S15/NS1 [Abeliophyllum distichum]|uniref:S15/NS1 n=1 Tax=Abeliophyllum distichum TaxID=126358 RepID=A0ABD1SV39_9LAMI